MRLHYIGILFLTLILGNNVMADKMIVDDMKNQSGIPDEEFCESEMLSGVLSLTK